MSFVELIKPVFTEKTGFTYERWKSLWAEKLPDRWFVDRDEAVESMLWQIRDSVAHDIKLEEDKVRAIVTFPDKRPALEIVRGRLLTVDELTAVFLQEIDDCDFMFGTYGHQMALGMTQREVDAALIQARNVGEQFWENKKFGR